MFSNSSSVLSFSIVPLPSALLGTLRNISPFWSDNATCFTIRLGEIDFSFSKNCGFGSNA